MRVCNNCRKVNTDWPMRCRYCGAGLEGRLCPRNHVNPVDPELVFCGECGQPLERNWGAGFSLIPSLVAGSILIASFLAAGLCVYFAQEDSFVSALVALVILIFGVRLAFQILPPSARSLAREIGNLFLRLLFGTGNKG